MLLGPRATGKSTWLRQHLADAVWFNLLDEGLYQDLLRNPRLFSDRLKGFRAGSWVVVDEVQRLPPLLNEVQRFIEEKQLLFALSGSSARKLRRDGVNLLAGRLLPKTMHPLMPNEMGNDFDLEQALRVFLKGSLLPCCDSLATHTRRSTICGTGRPQRRETPKLIFCCAKVMPSWRLR